MAGVIFAFFLLLTSHYIQGKPGYGPGEQEYGHIQVKDGGFMFYWLFYTQDPEVLDFTERPLVIWLQGGPGASSTGYGNFAEIGPLHIDGSARESSWAKHVNLLFIDNPVGSGFSYVTDNSAYANSNEEIAMDLVNFTKSFYTTFPEFSKTQLYIFSEAYGGKILMDYSYQLDMAIKNDSLNIDFRGIALGDSWVAPVSTVHQWNNYLLTMGLVTYEENLQVSVGATHIGMAMSHFQYALAAQYYSDLVDYVTGVTYGADFYNILNKVGENGRRRNNESHIDYLFRRHVFDSARDDDASIAALMDGPVREALGIPATVSFGGQSEMVFTELIEDFINHAAFTAVKVMDNTTLEVTVYAGQLDLMATSSGNVQWVDNLIWTGENDWKEAERIPLVLDEILEGYQKHFRNMHFYWINRAGQRVPIDNPVAGLELLRLVTNYDQLTTPQLGWLNK